MRAIFGRSHTIMTLELITQIRGREAYLKGNFCNRHFLVTNYQLMSFLNTHFINVLRK